MLMMTPPRRGASPCVPRETSREDEIRRLVMWADNPVMVEPIDLEVACRCALDAKALQRGDAMGERWPDTILEELVIGPEIALGVRVFALRAYAAYKACAFWADPSAAGVQQHRRRRAVELSLEMKRRTLARRHWKFDPEPGGDAS
jgi:hypothetical protein